MDYAERSPAPVRVEEVKRICFWYKHAYSGTELSLGVLGVVNEIQMYSAMVFHTDSTVDGKPMYDLPEFRGLLNRPEEICTVEQINPCFAHGAAIFGWRACSTIWPGCGSSAPRPTATP